MATDCYDILHMGIGNTTGVYEISMWRTHKIEKVLCDMETDGGGWTVSKSEVIFDVLPFPCVKKSKGYSVGQKKAKN